MTLKFIFIVHFILLLQSLVLNTIPFLKNYLYLAVLVKDEMSTVLENKTDDFASLQHSEINTICSDDGGLLGFYTA